MFFVEAAARMASMITYHIVKIGSQPANDGSLSEGATCAAWAESTDKQSTEVIAAGLTTGEVTHRYAPSESQKIAQAFRNPRI
jgi:hypothetical protein